MKGSLKALYFLGVLAQIAIRLPHERRRNRTRIAVDRVGELERSLVGLLFVGSFLLPTLYALTPWLDRADHHHQSPLAGARTGGLGATIMAGALWLFWRSHADLGRNWSPSLQLREEHELVSGGVYRYIRHPMYASQWLWVIGQVLVLQNWIAGWAGLATTFVPLYALRVPREERMMLDRFGGEYRAYMHRTGRVIPRLMG
jgi:protein-S-isoprenylcysteine O-methyltransferase Ste14